MAGYEEGGDYPRIPCDTLRDWVVDIFETCGIGREDSEIVADVLVESDLRGIASHGVPRLRRLYVDRLLNGTIRADAKLTIVRETAATVTFDAGHGLGPLMAYKAMERTIQKARDAGVCLSTVGHSDHFGIAGYYATMALRFPGMAGIAMTNATPLLVPTWGKEAMLSTAPIAAAFPAGEQDPFVLDAATTAVAWGKIEIARRLGATLPEGLAVDEHGQPTTDPFAARALMPLGGLRATSGQKGYGLALLVEMLCSQLSGSLWSKKIVYSGARGQQHADTSHAFIAIDIQAFRPLDEYNASVDEMFATLRNAEPAEYAQRVMIPGDPEAITLADCLERGIALHPSVVEDLRELGEERGVPYPG
ncbi:MAG TPA: Ldh family oxidoreductase [Thermomicrobiales bacterium]|nr:Ldh family oxidoreductase [Thermomicrobiales bacterium]